MPSIKQIDQSYQFAAQMHDLVQASQEISVMKMQQIRQASLETRTYMEGIFDIFFDVKSAQRHQVEQLIKNRRQLGDETNTHDSVIVFISTDELFTGNIIRKVFQVFADEVRKKNTDIIIIGKIGRQLFEQTFDQSYPYTYSDLNINTPQEEATKLLISRLLNYKHINVFEGKYMSLVDQRPVTVNLSGETTLLETRQNEDLSRRNFLFEPDLEKIVTFFETQITATLFRLTINESKLANLGSRITTLESSLTTLEHEVVALEQRRKLINRRLHNKKQSQRLAGMSSWT